MIRWVLLIAIYICIDFYAYQALKTFIRNPWVAGTYFLVSILVLIALLYQFQFAGTTQFMAPPRNYFFGIFLVVFIPKIVMITFMFGEDVFRFLFGIYERLTIANKTSFLPSRRKFISTLALGIAAIPFSALLYGMFKGRYNFKVLKYELEFEDLPEAFDGFTITQISDIHSGSFDAGSYGIEKIKYAVNLVNEQQSDIILFTGDLVNNSAEEMGNWSDLFSTLKAPQGVFSVLGNHDYGDYVNWNSKLEKAKNLSDLKNIQKNMGWDLLLNESRIIKKGKDSIAIIGVENWGENGFKKVGNIDLACEEVLDEDFKIVMSHDPTHWKSIIKHDPRNFQLTLSGHTHGMQFGIEIPGWIKWSPIKYKYENWAGIYKEFGRYINVNRGFGYLAYPGRIGIWPEITVIRLKKKSIT